MLLFLQPAFLLYADRKIYDKLSQRVFGSQPTGKVVIVEVDETSLSRLGRWPWPRNQIGLLIEKITTAGAASIVLDMMFPEADTMGKNDDLLARSIADGPVVLGYHFEFGAPGRCEPASLGHPLLAGAINDHAQLGATSLFHASGATCSLPSIARAAIGSGFLNAAPDSDGMLRRIPLLMEWRGAVYPGLALAGILAQERHPSVAVTASGARRRILLDQAALPLDSHGDLLLRFRGPSRTFPYISAADVLGGQIGPGTLRGKIVLVGGSAQGLQDSVSTPVGLSFPGVEVHANIADNILKGDLLRESEWTPWYQLGLVALVVFTGAVAFSRISPTWGAFTAASFAVSMWLMSDYLLSRAGIFFSPLMSSAGCMAQFAVVALSRLRGEKHRTEAFHRELGSANSFMLNALELLTAIRDDETGGHLIRIQQYMRLLCQSAALNPRFSIVLVPATIEILVHLAPIHDIGKIGIPDRILKKPGPLSWDEYEEMKQHVAHGRRVLEQARQKANMQHQMLLFRLASEIVYYHHEHWDGTGYPEKLRGDAIPLAGRLLAVADTYDALTSKRSYKQPMSHAEATQVIASASGTQFDPDIVAAFLEHQADWDAVAQQYRDEAGKSAAAGAS